MANFLNLKAVLGLNASGFFIGMKQAQSAAKQISSEIKSQFANAFGTAAVLAFSKRIIDTADNIVDLSDRLDVSTKTLQEWGYAARKNSSDIQSVTRFFEALASSRDKALNGDDSALKAFERLGVSASQLRNSRLEDIGKIIANSVKGSDAQSLITSLKEVGGKGATELVTAFKSGLDDAAEAAHRAGQIMNEETLVALKGLKEQAAELAETFTGPVASSIQFISNELRDSLALVKLLVAGPAAYLGALSGGATKEEAMKIAGQAGAESFADYEKRKKAIQDQIAKVRASGSNGAPGLGGNTASDLDTSTAIHSLGMRVVGDVSRPEGLTSWQRAGAAVRQEAATPILKNIQTATEKTAERVEALKDLFRNTSNSGSGYGGGF